MLAKRETTKRKSFAYSSAYSASTRKERGRCREQGIKKVEKCLQRRLSTKAEHSCKRDVQLRILFVPVGKKKTFLAHKDVSLIPQKEQTLGQNGF